MVDTIEGHGDIGGDLNDGSEVEDPSEETDPTREEANYTTPFRARGKGCPVVHAASRRDGRCKLEIAKAISSNFTIFRDNRRRN